MELLCAFFGTDTSAAVMAYAIHPTKDIFDTPEQFFVPSGRFIPQAAGLSSDK
jgi:hypothetical protein